MKVVDNQAKKWRCCVTCPHCRSALEIESDDVRLTQLETMPPQDHFWVNCPCCRSQIKVQSSELPEWVQTAARIESQGYD